MGVVLGELTCQIRAYPWRRRTRAFAAGLLLDTQHVLWRGELRPAREDLYDPMDPPPSAERLIIEDDEPELIDFLTWAAANGVTTSAEIDLLRAIIHADPGSQAALAKARGIAVKTLRRRRDRAIAALQQVAGTYLAA